MSFPFKQRGRGVRRAPGVMNKTEVQYAQHLKLRQHMNEVEWFAFDCVKLKMCAKTTYTPDFMVMLANGEIEMHEVKGFWEDDARVKIKVCAELFPFRFVAITKGRDGWAYEYVGAAAPESKSASGPLKGGAN
jgi:hypothetical protein